MDSMILKANARDETGSRVSVRLRANGRIPVVLYGHKKKTLTLDVPEDAVIKVLKAGHHVVNLNHEGTDEQAVIKDIQYDTLTEKILHIDFTRVSAGERIKVELPLRLVGTPEGTKHGGIIQQELETVEVECTLENMPDEIEVRISLMEVNDILHASELPSIPGLVYLTDGKHAVVHILPPKKQEEEGVEEEAGEAEPEVLTERKEEEAEDKGKK